MRVIAGTAKGRRLKAVPGMSTRPTSAKVKEALFSSIGPFFEGGIVLDLFAGTGNLGIEALSRGARHAIFVDSDRKSIEVIRHNVMLTGFASQSEVYRNDAKRALKLLARKGQRYDLVFLDPPYRMNELDGMIHFMEQSEMLNRHAKIVMEHRSGQQYDIETETLTMIKQSVYGETSLTIYVEEGGQR